MKTRQMKLLLDYHNLRPVISHFLRPVRHPAIGLPYRQRPKPFFISFTHWDGRQELKLLLQKLFP